MSLSQPNNLGYPVSALLESYSFDNGSKAASNAGSLLFQASKEQIRKMFHGIKLPVSPYDTAWVAMVPCTSSPQKAQFPQCVNWLLNNQLLDGSWGLPDRQHLLMKDALLSTLASILALKQWGVGERQIVRGLEFIATNSSSATDEKQHSPVGFDVILSGMINQAKHLDINIPFRQSDADTVLHRRNIDLKRCSESLSEGSKAYLSYISEGLGKSQDLEMVMKYQRKNGSILNSPSATASVLSNLQNSGCLHYINTLLEKLGDAVPAIYPMELYARLQLIENIEKLGVHHHFQDEIRSGLAETYKCWLNGEEDIFQDVACLAMAFRILRSHGYNVLPDCLSRVAEEVDFCNTLEGYLMDMGTVMELYRASQMIIYPDEIVLEKLQYWTSRILKQRLSNGSLHVDRLEKHLQEEIDLALKFPHHANLQRFVIKRSIENYNTYNTRILKSTFRNIWGKVLLNLAVEDFNMSQVVHQEELNHLTRWVVEKELDKLQFARQKLAYCYFSAAATLSAPELSDARISWTKNGVLTTVVDDFFDLGGSREELHNLITLMEKWDVDVATDCCSDNVAIIFLALRDTICETGGRATAWQGRNVTDHVKEIWLYLLKSMLKEAHWSAMKSIPEIDEYISNGFVSFALGPIVLPTLYLIGPKLSEAAVRGKEMLSLFELLSTSGRLLNDIQGFKRESQEGKLNAVSLQMINEGMSKEEAITSIKNWITNKRRELLKWVLEENGERTNNIPRACRDLFWKMSTVLNFFYMDEDGFTSQSMAIVVKELLQCPIVLEDDIRS